MADHDPLLSYDDLRILESIVRDTTKSTDERHEAAERLDGQLAMRTGLMYASGAGQFARFARVCTETAESIRAMGGVLDKLIALELSALTDEQRKQVDHLVDHEDECVFDAIEKVTHATSLRADTDRSLRQWPFRRRLPRRTKKALAKLEDRRRLTQRERLIAQRAIARGHAILDKLHGGTHA